MMRVSGNVLVSAFALVVGLLLFMAVGLVEVTIQILHMLP